MGVAMGQERETPAEGPGVDRSPMRSGDCSWRVEQKSELEQGCSCPCSSEEGRGRAWEWPGKGPDP